MAALPNPFMNSAVVMPIPATDRAAVSIDAPEAAARFNQHFDWVKFLQDTCIGLPDMSEAGFAWVMGREEPAPCFLGDPSIEFSTMIAEMHRDVMPMLEDLARRAG